MNRPVIKYAAAVLILLGASTGIALVALRGEESVRFSIWFEKLIWNADETPVFQADLSHRGKSELRLIGSYELNMDGTTYVVPETNDLKPHAVFQPDADYRRMAFALGSAWIARQSGTPLRLTPGHHRVQLSFKAEVLDGAEQAIVRIVSNDAKFRILEPGKKAVEADVLEIAVGGWPGQKYTAKQVEAMHFNTTARNRRFRSI